MIIFIGEKKKVKKYEHTNYLGCYIEFVRLIKQARYDGDDIIEDAWVELYSFENDPPITTISVDPNKINECLGADYILCYIEDEEYLDVRK